MNGPFGQVGMHAQRHVGMERKAGPGPSKFMLNMKETIARVKIKTLEIVQMSHVVSLVKEPGCMCQITYIEILI